MIYFFVYEYYRTAKQVRFRIRLMLLIRLAVMSVFCRPQPLFGNFLVSFLAP